MLARDVTGKQLPRPCTTGTRGPAELGVQRIPRGNQLSGTVSLRGPYFLDTPRWSFCGGVQWCPCHGFSLRVNGMRDSTIVNLLLAMENHRRFQDSQAKSQRFKHNLELE